MFDPDLPRFLGGGGSGIDYITGLEIETWGGRSTYRLGTCMYVQYH